MAKPNDGCLGLSKKKFKVGNDNPFTIFGEDIAIAGAALPNIYLSSRSHIWSTVQNKARKNDDAITVVVRCLKRKKSRAVAPVSGDGDDDLTITIVFNEGGVGGDEVVNECCFEDVDYDP